MKKLLIIAVICVLFPVLALAVPITDTDGGGLLGTNNALLTATTAGKAQNEGQQTLAAATPARVVAANGTRLSVTVQNHGANPAYCGTSSTITAGTGPILLTQNSAYVFDRSKAAIYCISTLGTVVGFIELY